MSTTFLPTALLLLAAPSMSSAINNTRGIPYPALRYYVFSNLDNATQADVMDVLGCKDILVLRAGCVFIETRSSFVTSPEQLMKRHKDHGYLHYVFFSPSIDTNRTWNFPGTAAIEMQSYESIANRSNVTYDTLPATFATKQGDYRKTELEVLADLGLNDEAVYDCYVNHYNDYFWTELDEVEQRAFEGLGWNVSSWEGVIPAPQSEDKYYIQLDADEQQAAAELCYLPETWDEIGLQFWTIDYEALAYETLEIDTLETATLSKIKSVSEDDFGMSDKEIEAEEAESSAFSLDKGQQWSAVLASLVAFVAI